MTLRLPVLTEAEQWKQFVEIPYFTNKWRRLGLDDDDLRELQLSLVANPRLGPVIRGAGGLRKCRFAPRSSGKGKSGSFRVGYAYFEEFGVICLLAVFAKKDQGTISAAQRDQIRSAIVQLYRWVSVRR